MARPKTHYRVVVASPERREQLEIELVDLAFMSGRTFRLRVNGRWAGKVPVGSKTTVVRQLRGWWVSHGSVGGAHRNRELAASVRIAPRVVNR